MNTGAEDDSLSTPIFAFSTSSARAVPLAANTSKPASTSRANSVIPCSPTCDFSWEHRFEFRTDARLGLIASDARGQRPRACHGWKCGARALRWFSFSVSVLRGMEHSEDQNLVGIRRAGLIYDDIGQSTNHPLMRASNSAGMPHAWELPETFSRLPDTRNDLR